ncbi:MAG: KamA family radical SAM protein [Halobacteriovoraceae bacterium]|jgi:lysine 2,3-aminomutase|nr:KamA family radical SAM protein [Halobacteriovoraceae bacterium]
MELSHFTTTNQNWQEDFKHALKSLDEVNHFFNINIQNHNYSTFIPLTFAHKIKRNGTNGPLWRQFIPHYLESDHNGKLDPIGDHIHAKGNGIIHRYSNRILYTPTTVCPITCRYCFRKNQLDTNDIIFKNNLAALRKYLLSHPQVEEVILTGGDPLILSNNKLEILLDTLSQLNLKYVRIHTRTPIILPKRIDQGLISLLDKYTTKFSRIIFTLHTNHQDEMDDEVFQALTKLNCLRIERKTQTVLLKGINDSSTKLLQLFNRILDVGFTPYYLHHPDQVKGAMHFYLPIETGRKIYLELRDKIPGWAIPHYVIDNSQGYGKQLLFNPESLSYSGKLLDKQGTLREY